MKTAYQKELSAHAKMLLIPGHSRRTKVKAEMDIGSCVRWPYAPHLNEGPKMSMDSLLLPVPADGNFRKAGLEAGQAWPKTRPVQWQLPEFLQRNHGRVNNTALL